jgi:simple sugar transport system ATP-binding protein
MEEVMTFSDWVRVLQQGRLTAVRKTAETSPQELARLMVGREVLFRLDRKDCVLGEKILELRGISATDDRGLPALREATFDIHGGEILGIAGVAGNGQSQLAEVVTGLRRTTQGRILIRDKDLTHASPLEMIRAGVSHIPADRIGMGAVGNMAVADNLAMKGYRGSPISERGVLQPRNILEFAKRMIETFRIATPTPQTRIKFLSGGNIQKAILAREIDACDGLMVAVYPARGLDVGATEAVRRMLLSEREQGLAVLLISEDLEELLTIADRIAVLFAGQVMGIVPSAQATVEMLGLMMAGVPLADIPASADSTALTPAEATD